MDIIRFVYLVACCCILYITIKKKTSEQVEKSGEKGDHHYIAGEEHLLTFS